VAGSVPPEGFLLLEDGTLFRGRLIGAATPTVAEGVFTTNMTGYQEVFSDPSYNAQIVVMTAPMIGNYGVNTEDPESARPQVAGVVVREFSSTYSNWRATGSLGAWLGEAGVPVLTEIDTRRLARHLRSRGVMRGVIAAGTTPSAEALAALDACPAMVGLDLASVVTTRQPYAWGNAQHPYHVVAYDFGVKRNILRLFDAHGVRVTDAGLPMFGICLGHQLLGLSFGGHTTKMPFGHRGGNQPVKELASGKVLITSQNHGFAVAGSEADGVQGAPELQVTHVNLNDGTIEGLRHRARPIFGVQYHPEAAPGPHDAVPHFAEFLDTLVSLRA